MANRNGATIGAKGETLFEAMCLDVELVCNKSVRDLTGWDYIVEAGFDENAGTFLDSRTAPLSCHFQIKTTTGDDDSFKMRLSSAERLAKEPKPSFVYFLQLDAELRPFKAFLIHLLDKPLATILKRLRHERSKGCRSINKKSISMCASREGRPIEPTGQALKAALLEACGQDLQAYVAKKAEQLAGAGFAERPIAMEMTIGPTTAGELVDAFLGIKKALPVKGFRGFEERFGIRIPIFDSDGEGGIIEITPNPSDTCKVHFRESAISMPATFQASIFFPPFEDLHPDLRKFRIDAGVFSLTFNRTGWSIEVGGDPGPQTLSNWVSFWRMSKMFALGKGEVEIFSETKPISGRYSVNKKITNMDLSDCEKLLDLVEKALFVLTISGADLSQRVPLAEIWENASEISVIYALAKPTPETVHFSVDCDWSEEWENSTEIDILVVRNIQLGQITLAWSAIARSSGTRHQGGVKWASSEVSLKSVAHLQFPEAQYERFVEAEKLAAKCDNFSIEQLAARI